MKNSRILTKKWPFKGVGGVKHEKQRFLVFHISSSIQQINIWLLSTGLNTHHLASSLYLLFFILDSALIFPKVIIPKLASFQTYHTLHAWRVRRPCCLPLQDWRRRGDRGKLSEKRVYLDGWLISKRGYLLVACLSWVGSLSSPVIGISKARAFMGQSD